MVGAAALHLRHRRGAHLRRADQRAASPRRSPRSIVACVAQAARDVDEGVPFEDPPRRLIEENLWRAVRHGLDGKLLDLDAGIEIPAAAAVERLAAWTAPIRAELGIERRASASAQRRPASAAR